MSASNNDPKEPVMNHYYRTLDEALADGWRVCSSLYGDKDVSAGQLYGYDFEAPDGRKSETVSLSEVKNAKGTLGAFRPMIHTLPEGAEAEAAAWAAAQPERDAAAAVYLADAMARDAAYEREHYGEPKS